MTSLWCKASAPDKRRQRGKTDSRAAVLSWLGYNLELLFEPEPRCRHESSHPFYPVVHCVGLGRLCHARRQPPLRLHRPPVSSKPTLAQRQPSGRPGGEGAGSGQRCRR